MSATENDKNSIKVTNPTKKPPLTDRQEKNKTHSTINNENELFYLPRIEKRIAQKAFLEPTSLVTRYLSDHSNFIIKDTEEDMKRPIKIPKSVLKKLDYSKKHIKSLISEIDNSNNCVTDRANSINCFTSKKEKKKIKKIEKNNIYITNINIKKENEDENKKSENLNTISSNNLNYLSQNFPKKIDYPNSMNIDHLLTYEKCQKLNKIYRRVRTYQPLISSNWKNKAGLSVTIGKSPTNFVKDDVYSQCNIFQDQTKLLESDILFYKVSIVSKENYIESFKSLSLESKINYNKALEETIGILMLLPQLILTDFYRFIVKFDSITIPNKSKFIEKYIFNEVDNLYYNNNLLSECLEFFLNCFEVYLILIKEVDGMALKEHNFNNALTAYEKARYNINYVVNSSKNAIDNYKKDVKILNKFNKEIGIHDPSFEQEKTDKVHGQFVFKKNEERQRKIRIEACLNYRKLNEDDNETKKLNKRRFKSIINSNLVSKLLKHCRKDIRQQITTQRINTEIDGENGEEGNEIAKSRKVIKVNF